MPVSSPWQYSDPIFDYADRRSCVRRLNLQRPRREVRNFGDVLTEAAPSWSAPKERSRVRLIAVECGEETACLTLAFMRFAELHGRIVSEPNSRCAIQTAVRPAQDSAETKIVTLWSRRAAEAFDRFWPRYRLAYGGLA